MKTQKNQTALDLFLAERAATDSGTEGVDFINLDKTSSHEVGRMLAPSAPVKFSTVFGMVGNMLSIMNYLAVPGFPRELLSKQSITKEEAKRIPRGFTHVPNYWALVAYALCERVKADKSLKHLLQKQKINNFTAYSTKTQMLFGKQVLVRERHQRLNKYVAVVSIITRMLKNGTFNDATITQFINDCKEHPELDLYAGIEHTGISISEAPEHHPDDFKPGELILDEEDADGHFVHTTTSYEEEETLANQCDIIVEDSTYPVSVEAAVPVEEESAPETFSEVNGEEPTN